MDIKKIEDFLMNGDIIDCIVKDMDELGYVGEYENKVLGYLIGISRKLDEPLSGIVVSASGAGKSKLVDTIQLLTPKEDVVFTSKLTPQSLYYMQKDFLKNKLLIIEERTGSELADYAIRTLQSKGSLSLATAVKNRTQIFEVEGPVSILETTTSYRLNSENVSRCFILNLDESKLQTERIHKYQRFLKTHEGIQIKQKISRIVEFHHNLQRLIEPYPIIIPYAKELTFPINSSSSRRDNQKLLTLIESLTLLHQYQREKFTKNNITYLISNKKDYKLAYNMFKNSYKSNLMFTHPKASMLLNKINSFDNRTFTRKDIADYTGLAPYQVRDNIKYLEQAHMLEVASKPKGKEALYRLNNNMNLTSPEGIRTIGLFYKLTSMVSIT